MQDVIADGSHAAIVASQGRAPESAWTAPLGTGRLLALLVLTCGGYVLFYLYKTARDLRDHVDRGVTPWAYPLSILIGLANAIAGARLAGVAQRAAGRDQLRESASPGIVGFLIFVAHVVLTVVGTLTVQSFWVVGVFLFALPWLLLERQLDVIKAAWPNVQYRTKPHRFTKLQWVALVLGGVLWALIIVGLWDDVVRLRGTALAAGVAYEDPQGRFSLTPSRSGWLIVAPGSVVEDADLELYGPSAENWAVVHVVEQAGRDLDTVVDVRYGEISAVDENVRFTEKRELLPGTNTVVSRSSYRGIDPFSGPFLFSVAAFVTKQGSVELIAYEGGRQRSASGGEELARSLKPATAPESAADE